MPIQGRVLKIRFIALALSIGLAAAGEIASAQPGSTQDVNGGLWRDTHGGLWCGGGCSAGQACCSFSIEPE
jgi:hypothetical protein